MQRLIRAVALAGCATLLAIAGGVSGRPAYATVPAACTGGIQVTSFTFDPPAVVPGQSSTATLNATSCTGQAQQGSVMWYGLFQGTGTGIPAGCVAIDPLVLPLAIPGSGPFSTSFGFQVPPSCTATALRATVTVRAADGTTLTTQNADLTVGAVAGACSIGYRTQSQWQGGFVAAITIGNSGPTPLTGWSLSFTFAGDQIITGAWGAVITQSGAGVTATNASYDATVPAGGSVTFGLQGTWHSSDAAPSTFLLNGHTCPSA